MSAAELCQIFLDKLEYVDLPNVRKIIYEEEEMACLCKNEDGTFSGTCKGTCTQKSIKQIDGVNMRSEKSIEDKIEYILGIFLKKVEEKMGNIERMSMEKWKEGFRQGYASGLEDA